MPTSTKRIAINLGGGYVPGLNSVLTGAVLAAHELGWEVVGIRDGYEGVLFPERYAEGGWMTLTPALMGSLAGATAASSARRRERIRSTSARSTRTMRSRRLIGRMTCWPSSGRRKLMPSSPLWTRNRWPFCSSCTARDCPRSACPSQRKTKWQPRNCPLALTAR